MSIWIDEIYGHPRQIQPSHIVLTSPHFDTREIKGEGIANHYRPRCKIEDAPLDVVLRLRKEGQSYKNIAEMLDLSWSSVRRWCKRYGGRE